MEAKLEGCRSATAGPWLAGAASLNFTQYYVVSADIKHVFHSKQPKEALFWRHFFGGLKAAGL